MKLLILDGNSIINRAFYGIRQLNAPYGTPTNGIYGFLAILHKLLDGENPESVCVTFDLKAPTFRHLRYDGYKAQRKGMPPELAAQIRALCPAAVPRWRFPMFPCRKKIRYASAVWKLCRPERSSRVLICLSRPRSKQRQIFQTPL